METLQLSDYHYELPAEKIAQYPLEKRDASKLLFYRHGAIEDKAFGEIADLLPESSFLFFNDTRVIPARLHIRKPTGAIIEIFLLEAREPSPVVSITMEAHKYCVWSCLIGNKKRFKEPIQMHVQVAESQIILCISLLENNLISFSWEEEVSFAEILHYLGKIPLPPYIKREAEASDWERYQTVFAKNQGAVATPTASLHFTTEILEKIAQKCVKTDFLTLHVGAGTFQPIKVDDIREHSMHAEQMVVSKKNIENVISNIDNQIIAVGTTSMRTLESLYWLGVDLLENPSLNISSHFFVSKLSPYQLPEQQQPSVQKAFEAIAAYMHTHNLEQIRGETEIFIFPSYHFKVCKGIITNFHMPQTTLILLIAAFVGEDWKKIYNHALHSSYRFLSYGDSSLLLPKNNKNETRH